MNKAITLLKKDDVVGMPTETVYGLAASIQSETGLKKIFHIKERPFFDPLIIHVSSVEMAIPLVKTWPALAQKLANAFWPGPLTMVLPKSNLISDLITSGLDSVGLRCPNHPVALELIENFGIPLAAPSANRFTKTSPTKKEHVVSEFNHEVFVLEGGECRIGIESTVVGVFDNEIKIYRPGMISKKDIQKIVAEDIRVEYVTSPVAPGQMQHHYMPNKPVILCKVIPSDTTNYWVVPDSAELAARELYSKLRELDQNEADKIVIVLKEEFKNHDQWPGILNRLSKAKTEDYYFI